MPKFCSIPLIVYLISVSILSHSYALGVCQTVEPSRVGIYLKKRGRGWKRGGDCAKCLICI